MLDGRRSDTAWAWFAPKTSDCAPLDHRAYPSIEFLGRPIAWPDWACQAPDGGIHIDARRTSLDIHLAKEPKAKLEFTWTCNFGARLVARPWLSLIEDLIDEEDGIFTGEVLRGERTVEAWLASVLLTWSPRHLSPTPSPAPEALLRPEAFHMRPARRRPGVGGFALRPHFGRSVVFKLP